MNRLCLSEDRTLRNPNLQGSNGTLSSAKGPNIHVTEIA
jgi:hypothetical protein